LEKKPEPRINIIYERLNRYTRFEKARIIGARALQITMGAPVFIDIKGDPLQIALEEFKRGLIPITVKRKVR